MKGIAFPERVFLAREFLNHSGQCVEVLNARRNADTLGVLTLSPSVRNVIKHRPMSCRCNESARGDRKEGFESRWGIEPMQRSRRLTAGSFPGDASRGCTASMIVRLKNSGVPCSGLRNERMLYVPQMCRSRVHSGASWSTLAYDDRLRSMFGGEILRVLA